MSDVGINGKKCTWHTIHKLNIIIVALLNISTIKFFINTLTLNLFSLKLIELDEMLIDKVWTN